MNPLLQFFKIILYQPLLNALVLLYLYLPGHDFGIAVIVLTLVIRLILHPFSLKGMRSQKMLSELQPKIKEIQEKFKADKQSQSKALMELYQKEKISPFSGCLPLLLQLPILIALYQVFLEGLKPEVLKVSLYGFVPNPGAINPAFLGVFNLHQKGFILGLAVIAGIVQFLQAKISMPKNKEKRQAITKDFSSMMQGQTLYFFPVLTFFIIWKFGAVIGLYWLVSTAFSIVEQILVNKKYKADIRNS